MREDSGLDLQLQGGESCMGRVGGTPGMLQVIQEGKPSKTRDFFLQNQGFSSKTRDFPAKQPRALPTSLRQARLSWSSKVSHGRPWQGRERLWSRRIPVPGDEHTLELPGISIREKLWAHPTRCEVVTWFEIKRGARGTAERSWRKEVTPESPGTPNPIQPLPPPLCSIFSS